MRTFVLAGYALSRFCFRVKCWLTGDSWRETAGLWGLHLLDLETLRVFPQHPRQFLPSAVWRAQRKELERGQGSRFQGIGAPPLEQGGRTDRQERPSFDLQGNPRRLCKCQKCDWAGFSTELLDGEACPRCRLVL